MYNTNAGLGQAMLGAMHSILPGLGKVFFVGDAGTVDLDRVRKLFGVDPDGKLHYFDDLEECLNSGAVVANRGDVILLAPGHTETVTGVAGINVDIAGVAIIGLGRGSLRPTVNFTTAVGASFKVTAANVLVQNVLFTGGIDALTNPVHVDAADCTLLDVETRDVTGQATDFIVTTANADRLRIERWTHRGAAAAGADTALSIVGGDGAIVRDFWIDGNFAVACIENVTTACTNITVNNGYARTRNAADVVVTLVATATGNVGPNINARLNDNAANITEAFVGADAQFFQPINIVNLDGESSMQTNITASTDA